MIYCDISGGRVLWNGMRETRNRAGQLFRMAALGLHHDLTPMGDHLRRMQSKIGPAAAQTATAHKIAIIFYTMVKNQVEYDEVLYVFLVWSEESKLRPSGPIAGARTTNETKSKAKRWRL
jgi:hypothetical protein